MTSNLATESLKCIALSNAKRAAGHVQTLPINVFSHLVSNKHKKAHRFAYGGAVILIGTVISKTGLLFNSSLLHIGLEGFGFLIHAAGCMPFLDHFLEKVREGVQG